MYLNVPKDWTSKSPGLLPTVLRAAVGVLFSMVRRPPRWSSRTRHLAQI